MKRLYAFLIAAALCFPSIGAMAWWQSIQQVGVGAAPAYQGPGDVVSGALMWGSCARVYNAALASTSTSLCDLVAVTGGAAVCTLRATSSGFVDLAASYCAGTTPAAACAAASGLSCKVTKVYDQTVNANHWTNATLSSMPALTFSALNGLPGMTFAGGSNSVLTGTNNVTQAQPFSFSSVGERTAVANSQFIGALSTNTGLNSAGANFLNVSAGTAITLTGNDNVFHSMNGTLNNTTSGYNVDGTDSGNQPAGTNTPSAEKIRIGRSNGATSLTGVVMEAGMWPSGFSAADRGNISTNQHSAANGYNF